MKALLSQINSSIQNHKNTVNLTLKKYPKDILNCSKIISNSLKKKGTIFWCGNGGSASDSLHLSAELIGKLNKNRLPLASIALTGNPATLTCISNDFGFEKVFSRQILP